MNGCNCLLQFPRIGSRAAEPCSRSDTVFLQNCCTVGFSLRPPAARCFPKNDSAGSWHNFSVSKYSTPCTDNKTGAISRNARTGWGEEGRGGGGGGGGRNPF